jgi:hypothetical protein
MSLDWVQLFLLGLVMVIGGLIGAFVAVLLTNRSQKTRNSKSNSKVGGNNQEIVQLYRNPANGKMVISFHGKTILDPGSLPPKDYEILIRDSKDLTAWLGIDQAATDQKPSVPDESPTPLPSPAIGSTAFDPLDGALPSAPVVPVPAVVKLPFTKKIAAEPVKKTVSIVEQINEILQVKLRDPSAAGKKIHLAEDPREGVIVWINGIQFIGIDSVTEPEAKALIRSAVTEWELRTSTGSR